MMSFAEGSSIDSSSSSSSSTSSSTSTASAAAAQHDNEDVKANSARRVGNLDHWDAETLCYYLGIDMETFEHLPPQAKVTHSSKKKLSTSSTDGKEKGGQQQQYDQYAGYDAAIMFYAQWCPNCHALAPLWDQIATLKKAGTISSNLILALFDCEKNELHQQLCTSAGVTHYPTLMYVGATPYHDILGSKERKMRKGIKKLKRATKFKGNWQYGEQILDWITTMNNLSSWYQFVRSNPIMRVLRSVFRLPFTGGAGIGGRGKGKTSNDSLPVGIPLTAAASVAGGGGSAGAGSSPHSSSSEVIRLKAEIKESEKKHTDMEKAATHASLLIESMLFPSTTNNNETEGEPEAYVDTFVEMTKSNAWMNHDEALEPRNHLVWQCMADLSLDYCTRLTTETIRNQTFLDSLDLHAEGATLDGVEVKLLNRLKEVEPFCAVIESCILESFTSDVCQPEKCPFTNDLACRYIASCLNSNIQNEYATLLKLDLKTSESQTSSTVGSGKDARGTKVGSSSKGGGFGGGGGWGIGK